MDYGAISDLTEIVSAQKEVIDALEAKIKSMDARLRYVEKYARMRRPSVIEAMGDMFSSGLRNAMGE